MASKRILDSVQVPRPCGEAWENMIGDNAVRFCLGCDKNVYNLSAMSEIEAIRFAEKNEGKVCIRFARLPDGRILTTERTRQLSTKTSAIAAGVIAATVSLSVMTYSQGRPVLPKDGAGSTVSVANRRSSKSSLISFTVTDERGFEIPQATVTLTSQKTKMEFTAATGEDGIATFSLPFRGRYRIEASSKNFDSFIDYVQVGEPVEPNLHITLMVPSMHLGIFVNNWSEIPVFEAIAQKNNAVVAGLISAGFNVNTKDKENKTALHIAVSSGNLEIARMLLERRARVNDKTRDKLTPIWLIGYDDEKTATAIFQLLISHGANVNVTNEQGETLLMTASDSGNLERVKLLLDAAADPNLKDKDGKTAYQKTNSAEIRQLLLKHGARSPLDIRPNK